jgi:hypothetical protein
MYVRKETAAAATATAHCCFSPTATLIQLLIPLSRQTADIYFKLAAGGDIHAKYMCVMVM